jgi:hypothetical protein
MNATFSSREILGRCWGTENADELRQRIERLQVEIATFYTLAENA